MSPRLPSLTKSQSQFLLKVTSASAVVGLLGFCAIVVHNHAFGSGQNAPASAIALHQTLQTPGDRKDPAAPVTSNIALKSGETLIGALQRAGVPTDQAHAAAQALSSSMDVTKIRAGESISTTIAGAAGPQAAPRLLGLSLRTSPVTVVALGRDAGGAFQPHVTSEQVRQETAVAQGSLKDSLYVAAQRAGADGRLVAEAVKLFSHKVDFSRDLQPDDHFKLVFDRKVADNGRTVETGGLVYAELEAKGKTTRFYKFNHDGKAQFFDEFGKNIKGFLLKTPVDAVRITSGFGMRFHPVLGFNRMHQGIDFGASTGTPVFAAGDGVVEEMKWAGGYGRWLKIKHNGAWATGYGHLSGYARGLRVGQHISQGQVVGYVGMTGLATGPHLHYEIMNNDRKVNPSGVKTQAAAALGGRELAAFNAEKSHIEQLISQAVRKASGQVQTAQIGNPAISGGAMAGAGGGGGGF